ncbi:MAG: hypothetical protein EBR79_01380 [Proteobacteria bacterium]|nr:hypothetical protein [Pseudomonadota bacterium]NBX86660.1 hypothetical protein [Pseudomonadota bacterium]
MQNQASLPLSGGFARRCAVQLAVRPDWEDHVDAIVDPLPLSEEAKAELKVEITALVREALKKRH